MKITITLAKSVEVTGGSYRDCRDKVVCKNTDIDEVFFDACRLLNASTWAEEVVIEGEIFSFIINKESAAIYGQVTYEFSEEKIEIL